MQRIDSHHHLWQLNRGDYHWLDENDAILKPIARDFDVADLRTASSKTGVSKFIVVQAAETEAESEYLLELAKQNEEVVGVVGWVDLENTNLLRRLEAFSKNSLFKGIRPMLQDMQNTEWLLEVPPKSVWRFLVEKDLRFDALIRPRHLKMLHIFCEQYPDLQIVIDHAAKPQFASGDVQKLQQWKEEIAAFKNQQNVFCKISGLLTEMNQDQIEIAFDVLNPIIEHLIEVFGPSRIMWGSDWPVLNLAGDYAGWYDLTNQLLDKYSDADIESILGGTASNFYNLEVVAA